MRIHARHPGRIERLLLLVVLGGGLSGCVPAPSAPDKSTRSPQTSEEKATSVTIFSDKPFYQERSEPEQTWTGVLRRVPVVTGPNTRGLPYQLETSREVLKIYAAGPEETLLKPFLDLPVKVIGKRVDLQAEGFSIELWPGSIASRDK